jgi:hypothetical protein
VPCLQVIVTPNFTGTRRLYFCVWKPRHAGVLGRGGNKIARLSCSLRWMASFMLRVLSGREEARILQDMVCMWSSEERSREVVLKFTALCSGGPRVENSARDLLSWYFSLLSSVCENTLDVCLKIEHYFFVLLPLKSIVLLNHPAIQRDSLRTVEKVTISESWIKQSKNRLPYTLQTTEHEIIPAGVGVSGTVLGTAGYCIAVGRATDCSARNHNENIKHFD